MDIAALLIKFNTCVNAVDRWGFTPLHEAAQKGRTQLCSLLVRYVFISCRFRKKSDGFSTFKYSIHYVVNILKDTLTHTTEFFILILAGSWS